MPWGPEDWDALAVREARAAHPSAGPREVLERTLRSIPERELKTVADLGCGTGAQLPLLASCFKRVVAVDYAPAVLSQARRLADGLDVEFRRRDLRDLKPLWGRLHCAVAMESILGPRSSDIDRVFEQVRRCLVEGGVFVSTFPAVARDAGPYPLTLNEEEDLETVHRFHEIEVQYRLRRAGFRGVRIRRLTAGDNHPEILFCHASRRANN